MPYKIEPEPSPQLPSGRFRIDPAGTEPPQISPLEDFLRGAETGVRKTASQAFTGAAPALLFSDYVVDPLFRGVQSLFGMETSPEAAAQAAKNRQQMIAESQSNEQRMQELTGPYHQAQGEGGKWGETAGGFIGGALLPGGPWRRLAGVALPTIGKEGTRTAQEFVGGDPNKPVLGPLTAPDIGGILGGAVSGASVPSGVSKVPKGAAPSIETTFSKADAHYNFLSDQGIRFDPADYAQLASTITQKLTKKNVPGMEGTAGAFRLQRQIEARTLPLTPPSFDEINNFRKKAGELSRGANEREQRLGKMFRSEIDKFFDNAPITSATGISSDQFKRIRHDANTLWQRAEKAKSVQEVIKLGSSKYVSGTDSGLQRQAASLQGRIEAGREGPWTEAEKRALEDVHKPTGGRRMVHALASMGIPTARSASRQAWGGSFFPLASTMAGTVGPILAGRGFDPVMAAKGLAIAGGLQGVSSAAQKALPGMTKRAAENVQRNILVGPAGQTTPKQQMLDDFIKLLIRQGIAGTATTPNRE